MKNKIPKILRQNPIQSFKDWKEGFKHLTPLDHAYSKRTGHFWGMLGAICAFLSLGAQVTWSHLMSSTTSLGFTIIVGSFAYLQFIEWRKEGQKIDGLKKIKEMQKTSEGNAEWNSV